MYSSARHVLAVGLLKAAVVVGFTGALSGAVGFEPGRTGPEESALRLETLPWDSTLTTERRKATLVLVLDAWAPSAAVTLSALRHTIAGREEVVVANVVFVVREDEFVPRSLWGDAASIPGVHVLRDAGGVEAARLTATTGMTVLYRADRQLQYRGASMQELPPMLDHPATHLKVQPPRRKDAAQRRPGPLDDWIEPESSADATL